MAESCVVESEIENPIARFIAHQGVMVLDGGLATALEARGCDLDDDLWSAKVLLEAPDVIRQVHRDFLAAGADCIATTTYQATIPGFRKRGLTEREGVELLRQSVRLAVEARDEFWSEPGNHRGRLRPIVAASIGPYGAYLADGSEYTGERASVRTARTWPMGPSTRATTTSTRTSCTRFT
jgi:homocysteine S-methyltransferase